MVRGSRECEKLTKTHWGSGRWEKQPDWQMTHRRQRRCSVTLSDIWVGQGCVARRGVCPTGGQRSRP